jgi:hypothetical protein
MSLAVGTNSWATVAEGDTYLTDRIDASDWFALPDAASNPGEVAKESLLVSAFYWLTGSPLLTIAASSTDANVKNGQIEAALYLLQHYDELSERRALRASGVTDIRLSRRRESLDLHATEIPSHILGFFADYVTGLNVVVQLKGHYDE